MPLPVNEYRGPWPKLIVSGLAGGVVINVIEWIAHRVLLDEQWRQAFVALGRLPAGWNTFIAANFLVGVIAVWTYRWLSKLYGRSVSTAIRTAFAIWIVFWVIPILGMQPLDIFPNSLIAWVIIVGIADGILGILPGIWLYERLTERG